MRIRKPFILGLLLATFLAQTSVIYASNADPDIIEMRAQLNESVVVLNQQGRLPLDGVIGGMVNNVWQTVRHPFSPAKYGCGGQSQFVIERLNVTGWHFVMRYEVGAASPILLPHQWITGYGPNGRIVTIDPWTGVVEKDTE